MRVDKYLKVSRLIKRRTVAKEVADQGRITINDQVAKSSTRVAVDDEITIQFGHRLLTVRVLSLKEGVRKEEAREMYEIVKEERIEKTRQEDE